MCYYLIENTKSELNYALCRGDMEYAQKLIDQLNALELIRQKKYKVSGFDHPKLLCFTNDKPNEPQLLNWGLIPEGTKSWDWAKKLRLGTLNAKAETMFQLDSFKLSAKNKRCLIYVDGFYDYHDQQKVKYPFKITLKSEEVMVLAGLWDEWTNKETGEILKTVAIVTVEPPAGHIMHKIHNAPKHSETPRMPLILHKEAQNNWFMPVQTFEDVKKLMEQALAYPSELLTAHPVKKLKGKDVLGNVPEVLEKEEYAELSLKV